MKVTPYTARALQRIKFRRYAGAFQFYQAYFADCAYREGYSLYPILNRPQSRGYIRLKSKDPLEHPFIQPNYLSDPRDVELLVEGKAQRSIAEQYASFEF
jgi:choline dehydrogenase-like flavoprotein